MWRIRLCAGHACYRAACLAGAAAVVVLVAVVVTRPTKNCSEPQRVELSFRCPGISVLMFASCLLLLSGRIVSVGDPERKYTGWERIGSG